MRIPTRLLAALVLITFLAACGGSGDSPAAVDNAAASIRLSATSAVNLQSGQTTTLTATVSAKDGHTIAGAPVLWSSSDPTVASVANGLVTAAKAGTATISAISGAVTTTVGVTVTPGAVSHLVIRTQPIGGSIGLPLVTQPVIELQDDAGNIVTSSTASVAATIASGTGTIGGTATLAAVAGVVTYTNLSVSGTAGSFTLRFTAGALTQTSALFTMTAPPAPLIVVDKPSVAFSVSRGFNPSPVVVSVTNGGLAGLSGLALETPTYGTGEPTGWLQASLSSQTAPSTMSLAVTSAALVEGTYHATIKLDAPNATNSPLSISVTLVVNASYQLTYGGSGERVSIVNAGSAITPATTIKDNAGAPATGITVTYTSRSSSVATVGADGKITARAAGDAWIVATAPGVADSVFVIVPNNVAGPVIRAIATSYSAAAGDTLNVAVVLDTRGTTVGSASLAVEINVSVGGLYNVPTTTPTPVLGTNTGGVYRLSVASAAGMSGSIALINFKLVGRTAGSTGFLNLFALDVSAVDGSSMNSQTTSTRFPVVIK